MIGTIVFVAAFVVLGLAVVLAAMRSGRGPAGAKPESRGARRALMTALVVGGLVLGVALPLLVITGNSESHAKKGPGGVDLTTAQANGRELFARNCGTCHTLAGSDAIGRVGPNLDTLNGGDVPKALVINAIQKGRANGNGQMPAQLLTGGDAQDVAEYVSRVAGR